MRRLYLIVTLIALGVAGAIGLVECSHSEVVPGAMAIRDSDWPVHSGDTNGTRSSVLGQITPENVKSLQVAWTYSSGEMKRRSKQIFAQSKDSDIPIKVGNSLLVCTPFNRVVSIDPASGKEKWAFDPQIDLKLPPTATIACRGVSYWKDAKVADGTVCKERVVTNTNDRRLIEIDLRTGRPCPGFGDRGTVRINVEKPLHDKRELTFFMPPVVTNDVIILGSNIEDYLHSDTPSGKVRAFDVRTGILKWEWDMIPKSPSDPAYTTWGNNSSLTHGSGNAWGFITADPARDMVFIPTSSAGLDMWGVDRPGQNKNTDSVVALQASTGKFIWAYQIVHHDLWDYDIAPQPLLADLPIQGKLTPVVIQNTKQGLIFVLDRLTGKPVFPVAERRVPKGDVPGEWYSPTQPFPTTIAPLRPLNITEDDAWGITPWDKAECKSLIRQYRHGGLYIPVSTQGTIVPWWAGGVEWPGVAYDSADHVMVVNSNRIFGVMRLLDRRTIPAGGTKGLSISGAVPMIQTPYAIEKKQLVASSGVPCTKPPFSGLSAIDMATGKLLWDVPLGSIERFVPFKPRINMDWWGVPAVGGPIITKSGLVFIAGTLDQRIRAFSLATGKELWNTVLPADAQTTPITYSAGGRQFVVISAGGNGQLFNARGDYVVAYALPRGH